MKRLWYAGVVLTLMSATAFCMESDPDAAKKKLIVTYPVFKGPKDKAFDFMYVKTDSLGNYFEGVTYREECPAGFKGIPPFKKNHEESNQVLKKKYGIELLKIISHTAKLGEKGELIFDEQTLRDFILSQPGIRKKITQELVLSDNTNLKNVTLSNAVHTTLHSGKNQSTYIPTKEQQKKTFVDVSRSNVKDDDPTTWLYFNAKPLERYFIIEELKREMQSKSKKFASTLFKQFDDEEEAAKKAAKHDAKKYKLEPYQAYLKEKEKRIRTRILFGGGAFLFGCAMVAARLLSTNS